MSQLISSNRISLKLFALAAALTALALPAKAIGVQCTFISGAPNLDFGTIDVLNLLPGVTFRTSTTARIDCARQNSGLLNGYMCLRIGTGTVVPPSGTGYLPNRWLQNGTNYAGLQIYKDSAYSSLWGSTTQASPSSTKLSYSAGVNTQSFIFDLPFYAELPSTFAAAGGASALKDLAPGIYTNTFNDAATNWRAALGFTVNSDCSGLSTEAENRPLSFTVTATVKANCKVSVSGPISFGLQPASATNLTTLPTTLDVQCTRTTPYNIALTPSNGNTTGAGAMLKGADQVAYQLRQGPAIGDAPWGSAGLKAPGGAGNTVQGTGTGSVQPYSVYATVPSTDAPAGNYIDTVTATVNY